MKILIKKMYFTALVIIICGAFCTKTPPTPGGGIITFSTGEVLVNSLNAAPGTEVKNGDTVKFGKFN